MVFQTQVPISLVVIGIYCVTRNIQFANKSQIVLM